MMNRRIAVALVSLSAVLLPISAYAAITNPKLQQLLTIVQMNKRPVGTTMELKVTAEEFSGQLLLDGRSNGKVDSVKDLQVDGSYTLNAGFDDYGSVTLKGQARAVSGMGYLLISDLQLTGELAQEEDDYKQYLNQWMSFPLDPNEYEEFKTKKKNMASLSKFDRFFFIRTVEDRGTIRYEVTLPANKQRAFLNALLGVARAYSPRANASVRKALRSTKIDISMTIATLLDNTFESFNGDLKLKTKMGSETVEVISTLNTAVLSSFTPVTVPAGSKTIEELLYSPTKQLGDARDAQRRSDINTIINAVYQYEIDNLGKPPKSLTAGKVLNICKTGTTCDGISLDVLTGSYLVRIPSDPQQSASAKESGYTIELLSGNRIRVTAPYAESTPLISVTR